MLQDLTYGLRWLRKNPGFTLLAVLMLAVGIGVNTAMFSVINAVLLQPLPYTEADRIVWMNESGPEVANRWVSYPNFLDWRNRTQSFEAMSTLRGWSMNITGSDKPENINARMVTADYFKVMGAAPIMGRDFTAADDKPGAAPVTLISFGFWHRHFGGDPNVVGKNLLLDDKAYTVIGVLPESFAHQGPPPLWILMGPLLHSQGRDTRTAGNVIARLKPGVTLEQARSEMNGISQQLLQEHPLDNAGANSVTVVLLQDSITRNVSVALKILFGAVALVLLIACANVANLLLARAAARRKEFAVRAALGASRFRIARQMLIESLLLAVAGGALGLVLAAWTTSLLVRVAHETVPRMSGLQLNGKVLGFNLAVSLLTGILFGVMPALRSSKTDLQETLKDSSSTTTAAQGRKLRGALVMAEVALSVALLIGAGLLVKSMFVLLRTENNFNPEGVLTMELKVSRGRYQKPGELGRLLHQVLDNVKEVPGVESASLSTTLPGLTDWQNDIVPEGYEVTPGELINVDWSIVSADYFQTMNVPILQGRTFSKDEDEQGKKVVLVDETLARRFWPGENAVGKRIKYNGPDWHEIIGVVKQVGIYGSEAKPLIKIYTPMGPAAAQRNSQLSIRSSTSDPASLAAAIASAVHEIDKDLPVVEAETLESILAREASTRRFNAMLFSVFAALALVLAATGVYGVLSYSVSQRTHEVGIRMALGAGSRDVVRLFMGQGMRLVFVGLVIGLGGALALTRLMSSLLFGVSTTDAATFVAVGVGLMVVGVFACYLPARRATKVDPLVALRYE
ncbi:MAG TPA: ABC transporter permease [Pyrinomonadaceae bacterium]|nr:ABC transporter permease [Pyrinomonadaceae bacterium]